MRGEGTGRVVAFEESVVASGGLGLSTVESYDVIADRWPTRDRYVHGMVAVAGKMYAVGGSCEVFDKGGDKFVGAGQNGTATK